jgi:hypothetical protein
VQNPEGVQRTFSTVVKIIWVSTEAIFRRSKRLLMYFRKEAWLKPSWFTKATKGVRMSLYHHKVVGFFLRLSPTEGSSSG